MKRIVVVGAGMSGLCTATRLLKNQHIDLVVTEAKTRAGGTIETKSKDGFVVEAGPNGFLSSRIQTVELVDELNITSHVVPADDSAKKRFIVRDGALVELPASPLQFLATGALSRRGRARMIIEGLIRKRPVTDDETVFEFASRRVGHEAASYFIDAMVSGIFAGDSRKLSLKSAFPRLYELERAHGSLTRALVKVGLEHRKSRGDRVGPSGFGGTLLSFNDGMSLLTDRLAGLLKERLHLNHRLVGLAKDGPRWVLEYDIGQDQQWRTEADAVVLAIPAYETGPLLKSLDSELAEQVSAIPYAPVVVLGLGFSRGSIAHPLDGFGFLNPSCERRSTLGAVWTSSVFPNRAPDGSVLIRAMAAGAHRPEQVDLSDDQLLETVCKDLDPLIGLRELPHFSHITRWPRGIPQYPVGHDRRLNTIETRLGSFPGLFLTGNAYRGISLNDCVVSAEKTAERVKRFLR